ncbi:hypothetical protein OPT61_g7449 [Boeremia exigua]|uniref:Uncharacterized protein n=1 Tax=Boeremia exigua TaxID=749465 RepID=A0ACC2I274_9PLEO|nr:hypothetical protein OPT61_g7449 [Boeremia exigua]
MKECSDQGRETLEGPADGSGPVGWGRHAQRALAHKGESGTVAHVQPCKPVAVQYGGCAAICGGVEFVQSSGTAALHQSRCHSLAHPLNLVISSSAHPRTRPAVAQIKKKPTPDLGNTPCAAHRNLQQLEMFVVGSGASFAPLLRRIAIATRSYSTPCNQPSGVNEITPTLSKRALRRGSAALPVRHHRVRWSCKLLSLADWSLTASCITGCGHGCRARQPASAAGATADLSIGLPPFAGIGSTREGGPALPAASLLCGGVASTSDDWLYSGKHSAPSHHSWAQRRSLFKERGTRLATGVEPAKRSWCWHRLRPISDSQQRDLIYFWSPAGSTLHARRTCVCDLAQVQTVSDWVIKFV